MLKEYKETSKNNSPLSFLSSRLSQFTKATRIFTTRDYTHTNVAAEFHQACDNIPNTLVIIKSGQYIAGGYTEVAWSSPASERYVSATRAFLFSVNRRRVYLSTKPAYAMKCHQTLGPNFGYSGLGVYGDYSTGVGTHPGGYSWMISYDQSGVRDRETELMGSQYFKVDEYEVYKLE